MLFFLQEEQSHTQLSVSFKYASNLIILKGTTKSRLLGNKLIPMLGFYVSLACFTFKCVLDCVPQCLSLKYCLHFSFPLALVLQITIWYINWEC